MACLIRKNSTGNIVGVDAPNGQPSKLFEAIHSNVFMADPEMSIGIMSSAYSNEVERMFTKDSKYTYPETGEPVLYYHSPRNKEFDNLEEALIDGDSGIFTMGFKNPKTDAFMPIARFSTSASKRSEFVRSQVLNGILAAERVLGEDGVTRFQGKGGFVETRYAMSRAFQFEALINGYGNVRTMKDGTIEIDFPSDFLTGVREDGSKQVLHLDEIPDRASEFENRLELIAIHSARKGELRPLERGIVITQKNQLSQKSAERSLTSFLKNIGFSTATLEQYRKNFNTKYGNDPDIQALSDIANRVVAFSNGTIQMDQLTEEVAHIAIEAYGDQNSIMAAISNVNLSPEYAQHSEYYRQKYAPFFEGIELEEQVRKEVLGKILAKEFASRMEGTPVNEEQQYLIGKVREIWQKFIEYIRSFVRAYHVQQLSRLNKEIADAVLQGDMVKFQNDLSQNNKFFYSASTPESQDIERKLKIAKSRIEDMFKSVRESVPRAAELENIYDRMVETDILRSVNTIVGITANQIGILESNLKEADDKGLAPSMRDDAIARTIADNLIPVLNSLKLELGKLKYEEKTNKANADNLITSINDIVVRYSNIEPLIENGNERIVDNLFNKSFGEAANMTEEQKKIERARLKGNIKDLGFFSKYLGLASHSQNPVIQLMASKVVELNDLTTQEFKPKVDEVLKNIYEGDLAKYQKDVIKRDADNSKTYYYLSPINWSKYDKAKLDFQIKTISDITGKSADEVAKMVNNFSFKEILTDPKQYKEFSDKSSQWSRDNRENRFTDEYYKKRDERYNKLGTSELTRTTITNLNMRSFEILRPYMSKAGTIDKSKLSEGEKKALADVRRDRRVLESAYNVFGELREGIRVVKATELSEEDKQQLPYKLDAGFTGDVIVLQKGRSIEELPEDSRTTLDMNYLTMLYRQEQVEKTRTNKPNQAFIDKLTQLEKEGVPQWDWAISNASIRLSDEYLENIDSTVAFDVIAENYIARIEDFEVKKDLQLKLEQYRKLNRQRKNLLRQNQQAQNPLETDVKNMDDKVQRKIRELDSDIIELRRSMEIPQELLAGKESTSTKELNDHYKKLLDESGQSEYDFAIKHMPAEKRRRVEDFAYEISSLIQGKRRKIKKSYDEFFVDAVQNGEVTSDMTPIEQINALKDAYARENLASYFYRYSPTGYDKVMEGLKSGGISVKDMLENKQKIVDQYPGARNLEIVPDYSWMEDISNDEFINKNFKSGGYYLKPKAEYLDDEFFNEFGINKQSYIDLPDDDISKLTPTKNIEKFNFLVQMIKLREESFANYGDTESQNKYLLVQRSSSTFEKAFSPGAISKGTLKDLVKDLVQNRPDEQDYGSQLDQIDLMQKGSDISIRTIPKYYQTKLESPDAITESIIEAALADYQQSIKFKNRKYLEQDFRALEWQIMNQQFLNNGKSGRNSRILKRGSVSNYYEFGKEYLNHHLYGIQQTRSFATTILGKEIDITRSINAVQGWARFSNLGYNFFVDLTGATTGIFNNAMDRVVGEYYHKSSSRRAKGQVLSYLPNYVMEVGKVQKSSKMNALMEYFDVQDINPRTMSTKFGRGMRTLQKSPYLVSKFSNMLVTPEVLFALLNDHRFVDGKFRSYNEFLNFRKGNDRKSSDLEWATLEKESLFDHLNITDQDISPNEKFNEIFENSQEEWTMVRQRLIAKSKQLAQTVDGVLNEVDQVAAQRDVLSNLFMMHRGWLLINMTKRFKGRHYNISTNQYEEGHYRTLFRTLSQLITDKESRTSFKEWYGNLDGYEKTNLKRASIETSSWLFIMALGALVLAGEDDDDTWAEDLSRLIYLRTASEVTSSQLIGIPGSLLETVEQPVTAMSTIKVFEPFALAKSLTEETKEGDNKFLKKIVKASILRRYGQYTDIQRQIDAFRYFNDHTLLWLGASNDKKELEAEALKITQ